MEVDERPTEQYSDIGGLDQQIQEVDFSVLQVNPNYQNDYHGLWIIWIIEEKKIEIYKPRELPAWEKMIFFCPLNPHLGFTIILISQIMIIHKFLLVHRIREKEEDLIILQSCCFFLLAIKSICLFFTMKLPFFPEVDQSFLFVIQIVIHCHTCVCCEPSNFETY